MSRLNPGRLAAGRALLAVGRGAHAEDILAELAPQDDNDRRLAWHLVMGVLRRRGTLDSVLIEVSGRPMRKVDAPARAALRIGLFELNLGRTADHAAVDQAVELCRQVGGRRATGFVNAVLRKASKRPFPDDPYLDLPTWLADRWRGQADDWVARLGTPAPICGVWRDPDDPVLDLPVLPTSAGGQVLPGTFALGDVHGPVDGLVGFKEGRWWVMDPAAVAVAQLALPAPGGTVLDACAAPGGKSLLLAARGAKVTSVDLVPERLARVQEAASRTGLPLHTVAHDWLEGALPESALPDGPTFDAVLVDAPCTGLGTIRRHPEIRWRRQHTDPAAMALRQRRILVAAAQHVAPGGRLVYAVCSPMPEEGIQVAESLSGWTITGGWSSTPPHADEDAFQAFVLERVDDSAAADPTR